METCFFFLDILYNIHLLYMNSMHVDFRKNICIIICSLLNLLNVNVYNSASFRYKLFYIIVGYNAMLDKKNCMIKTLTNVKNVY